MKCEKIEIMISGYLDRELTQQENQQVRVHIDECTSCNKVYKEMKTLKEKMGQLSYPKSDLEVLDELENDLFARSSAGVGWFLVILGAVFLVGMGVIEFVTSENTSWQEKGVIALIVLGPLALLATVIRQRVMTYKNDKYRKVKL